MAYSVKYIIAHFYLYLFHLIIPFSTCFSFPALALIGIVTLSDKPSALVVL